MSNTASAPAFSSRLPPEREHTTEAIVSGSSAYRQLRLGSCPDSWGVWFADDPKQTPWQRFLDELSGVGYEWVELGPYGYLPTDPSQLQDELAARKLKVAGGTMHGLSGLHRAEEFDV